MRATRYARSRSANARRCPAAVARRAASNPRWTVKRRAPREPARGKKNPCYSAPRERRRRGSERAPGGRAQRPDFTLSQLHRAVVRLPPHAQKPLDDGVDVESRAGHFGLRSAAPFKSAPRHLGPSGGSGNARVPRCPNARRCVRRTAPTIPSVPARTAKGWQPDAGVA